MITNIKHKAIQKSAPPTQIRKLPYRVKMTIGRSLRNPILACVCCPTLEDANATYYRWINSLNVTKATIDHMVEEEITL